MLKLTTEQITQEFTKRFFNKDGTRKMIDFFKSTKCPYCSLPTTARTGEHDSCYTNTTDDDRGRVYQIRNEVMH